MHDLYQVSFKFLEIFCVHSLGIESVSGTLMNSKSNIGSAVVAQVHSHAHNARVIIKAKIVRFSIWILRKCPFLELEFSWSLTVLHLVLRRWQYDRLAQSEVIWFVLFHPAWLIARSGFLRTHQHCLPLQDPCFLILAGKRRQAYWAHVAWEGPWRCCWFLHSWM